MSSGNDSDESDDSDEDNGITGFVFGIVSRISPLPPFVSPLNAHVMRAGNVNKRGKLEPDAYDEETRENLDEAGNSAYSSDARAGLGVQQTDEAAAAGDRSFKMARPEDPGGAAGGQMPTGGNQPTATTAGLDTSVKDMAARVLTKRSDTAGDSDSDDYDFDVGNSDSDVEHLADASVSTSTFGTEASQAEEACDSIGATDTRASNSTEGGGEPSSNDMEGAILNFVDLFHKGPTPVRIRTVRSTPRSKRIPDSTREDSKTAKTGSILTDLNETYSGGGSRLSYSTKKDPWLCDRGASALCNVGFCFADAKSPVEATNDHDDISFLLVEQQGWERAIIWDDGDETQVCTLSILCPKS
jgi:hypothetical protein